MQDQAYFLARPSDVIPIRFILCKNCNNKYSSNEKETDNVLSNMDQDPSFDSTDLRVKAFKSAEGRRSDS